MAMRLMAAIAALAMIFSGPPAAAQTIQSVAGLNPRGQVVAVTGAALAGGDVTFSATSQSVVIDAAGAGAVTLSVQGTWAGTLRLQWSDKAATGFQDGLAGPASGSDATTITANQQYIAPAFGRYLRITSTAWTSGSAVVTPVLRSETYTRQGAGGGGGGGGDASAANQVTGNATLASIDTDIGALADSVCATDTASCSLTALIKRLNSRVSTVVSTLGTPFQAGGSIGNTVFGATQSGAWNIGSITTLPALPAGNNSVGDVGSASFSATCTTLTNPGTGGTYASGDLVANSATAGSVTPLTCTVARYSGGPVTITRARILTSTTGVSNASFRVHAYTGTPTVTNGNDGVFLSTAAGHFCRLDVTVDLAFSDGASGAGAPTVGTSCTRVLSGAQAISLLLEARAAYAWTAGQTYTVILEGFN